MNSLNSDKDRRYVIVEQHAEKTKKKITKLNDWMHGDRNGNFIAFLHF